MNRKFPLFMINLLSLSLLSSVCGLLLYLFFFLSISLARAFSVAYTHVTKTIEASRVHLFDIMTQFRAIFSDEDPIVSSSREDVMPDSALFHSWVVHKVGTCCFWVRHIP